MAAKETGNRPSIEITNMSEFTRGLTILYNALQAYDQRVETPEHSRDTTFIQVRSNATEFKPGDIAYLKVFRDGLAGNIPTHIELYEATGKITEPCWNCARVTWKERESTISITPRPRNDKERIAPFFSKEDERGIRTSLLEFLSQRASVSLIKTRNRKTVEVHSESTDCLMRWVYEELNKQLSQTPIPLPTINATTV